MEARVITSLQTSLDSRVPVAVGVYNGEVIVVCPGAAGVGVHRGAGAGLGHRVSSDTSLNLYKVYDATKEPLVLYGHRGIISALALSTTSSVIPHSQKSGPGTLLCSASDDSLLLWNVEVCFEQYIAGGSCSYQELVGPTERETSVTHLSFSLDSHYVALCMGTRAMVYSTKTCELDTILVGHTAAVTSAVFSPHKDYEVITVSEDRTFKIWDVSSSSLLYQSAIISASPFLCASLAFHGSYLATGTADGIIRIFDLGKCQGYKCIHKFDVGKEMEKRSSVSSRQLVSSCCAVADSSANPQWKQHNSIGSTHSATVEAGSAILGVYYWPQASAKGSDGHSNFPTSATLPVSPLLLAVTHLGILAFNAQTMEAVSIIDFKDAAYSIPTTATSTFSFNTLTNEVLCALGSMFSGAVSVLVLTDTQWHHDEEQLIESEATGHGVEAISVLSTAPLVRGSPLAAEFSFETKSASAGASKTQKGRMSKSKSSPLNQPLTFKSKVKSSGYSRTPRNFFASVVTKIFGATMFSPRTSFQKKTCSAPRNSQSRVVKEHEYPMSCGPVAQLTSSISLTDRPSAINSATFRGDGQYLACGCADKASYTVKMPLTSGRVAAFVGHDGSVLSTCWNHGGDWLVTSSTDKTARVWSAGHKDPLLVINTLRHNFRSTKDMKANSIFKKEITTACFYYLDKFILLTSGNEIYLYKYHIDTSKPDDIKRYQSNSHYKLVTSLAVESAQTITAMSTINDFHSCILLASYPDIALVGGSNKTVGVYDMNAGTCVKTIIEAHNRAVHCICQVKGSRYTSLPSSAYDMFLTSAITDGIKLWDLRTNRCVCRFTSHVNQSHPISATVSPCARFIATGSEDRAVYIYDTRHSSPLHKLTGHSDVVSTLAYHPLRPMIASATLDGKVSFLSE